MKIGIMGCGVISKQYIQDIQRLYRELEICMVADVHSDVAERTDCFLIKRINLLINQSI